MASEHIEGRAGAWCRLPTCLIQALMLRQWRGSGSEACQIREGKRCWKATACSLLPLASSRTRAAFGRYRSRTSPIADIPTSSREGQPRVSHFRGTTRNRRNAHNNWAWLNLNREQIKLVMDEPGSLDCRMVIDAKRSVEQALGILSAMPHTDHIQRQLRSVYSQLEGMHDSSVPAVQACPSAPLTGVQKQTAWLSHSNGFEQN